MGKGVRGDCENWNEFILLAVPHFTSSSQCICICIHGLSTYILPHSFLLFFPGDWQQSLKGFPNEGMSGRSQGFPSLVPAVLSSCWIGRGAVRNGNQELHSGGAGVGGTYAKSSLPTKKCGFFLYPSVSVAMHSWTLFCFKLWLVLKLEYGFPCVLFFRSFFKWKKLLDFSEVVGNIFTWGRSMERWLEIRVWHKEKPGRGGEERQEKASLIFFPDAH